MGVGQELLDVPLPDMVVKLALGIADAQRALDENSVETAKALAETKIEDVVLGITQTIAANGNITFANSTIPEMSLLQLGLFPTFYQFAEATIEVSMDIKTTTSTETNIKVSAKAKAGFAMWSASIAVDVSHNRKFQKEVRGTSRMVTRLVPVPPPPRLIPQMTTIDLRNPPPAPGG
jgi:hypothetical protein